MSVAHDLPPQTKTEPQIPTQTTTPEIEHIRELDINRTLLALETGPPEIPPSQKIVMSVYDQVAINYPGEVDEINSTREGFANRLELAYALYQEEIVDESSATGRNVAKLSDIFDRADELPVQKRQTFSAILELVNNQRVRASADLKVITMEAACIAAITELDRANPESLAQIISAE